MRFGGHETFYIRDGWLFKGVDLLLESPDNLSADHAFDYLGVGKNMAKSIRHWLLATGLAMYGDRSESSGRAKRLVPTDLAYGLRESDRYFADPSTWWLLHTNLLHNRNHAETWYWFFNRFTSDRFDRDMCLRRMLKYVQTDLGGSQPSQSTLERDLSCLFSTYATEVPGRLLDPEEDISCPFRELDLLVHYRDSGHLQLQRRRRRVDPFVFMYALERCLESAAMEDGEVQSGSTSDIRFFDLSRLDNNPMRVFALTTDLFFESLVDLEREHPELGVHVVGLAGDRQIRVVRRPALAWVEKLLNSKKDAA